MRELLLFQVDHKEYAMELPWISSIQSMAALSNEEYTNANESTGILEGQRMPVINLTSLFREDEKNETQLMGKLILLIVNSRAVAVKVDQIERIIGVTPEQVVNLPDIFKGKSLKFFPQIIRYGEKLMPIFSPEGIFETVVLEPIEAEPAEIEFKEFDEHFKDDIELSAEEMTFEESLFPEPIDFSIEPFEPQIEDTIISDDELETMPVFDDAMTEADVIPVPGESDTFPEALLTPEFSEMDIAASLETMLTSWMDQEAVREYIEKKAYHLINRMVDHRIRNILKLCKQ